jgi:hypothetical protein
VAVGRRAVGLSDKSFRHHVNRGNGGLVSRYPKKSMSKETVAIKVARGVQLCYPANAKMLQTMRVKEDLVASINVSTLQNFRLLFITGTPMYDHP